MLRAIVAYDSDRAIGNGNELLWQSGEMKSDMRRFREASAGRTIIMGRKTFESIGKPLPGRRNIVMSRTMASIPGVEVVRDLDEALAASGLDADVIGGEQIYAASLPHVDRVLATEVLHRFAQADAHFPGLPGEWHVTEDATHDADESNKYPYRFVTYERTK